MKPDEMKRIVEEMFDSFERHFHDPEKMLEHLDADAIWWVAGKTPVSGSLTKKQLAASLAGFPAMTETGLRMTAKDWLIAGDRVVVEAEGYMTLKDGRIYNNHYVYWFDLRDGKIVQAREFMDTQHVIEVYCLP